MLVGSTLLLKILATKDLKTFSKLRGEWFIDQEERKEFNRCTSYLHRYADLPPVSFINEFSEVSEHSVDYLLDELFTRYQRYSLSEIMDAIEAQASIEDINADIVRYLFDPVNLSEQGSFSSDELVNVLAEYIPKARESYIATGLTGLPTGWASLDAATGGYQDGDVFVFSGRAKIGKTMLMLYSVNNLLNTFQDKTALVISMEMTVRQVLSRLACLRAGVNPTTLRIGDITTVAEQRLLENLEPIKDRIYISEGNMDRDLSSVVGMIGAIHPSIIFVDGAYLIRMGGSYSNGKNWEEVKQVIERLKGIAVNFHTPVVCSYQLKRNSTTDPNLEHLALSDAIGQVASTVIGLLDTEMQTVKKVNIMGVREGIKDSFFVNWDWERLNFSEQDIVDQF